MEAPADKRRLEKQRRLFTSINGAIRDHLQDIGVAIIGLREGRPDKIASGTCIEIGGRYFVATAAHAIAPYPNEQLWLITRPERSDTTPRILARGSNEHLDIAWLEITPDALPFIKRRFVGRERLRPQVSEIPHDLCVVYGFPRVLVRKHEQERGLGVRPLCFATNTLEKPPEDCVPSEDVYLEYPYDDLIDANGNPVDSINADGLSGGGIWTVEANTKAVWSAEKCQLIGIQHRWSPCQYVRGTQIQHWLALLGRDIPELAPVVGCP